MKGNSNMAHKRTPRYNIVARLYIETSDGITGFTRVPVYGEGNSIKVALKSLSENTFARFGRIVSAPVVFHSKGFTRIRDEKAVLAFSSDLNLLPPTRRKRPIL
jgi:hypothetical protein